MNWKFLSREYDEEKNKYFWEEKSWKKRKMLNVYKYREFSLICVYIRDGDDDDYDDKTLNDGISLQHIRINLHS